MSRAFQYFTDVPLSVTGMLLFLGVFIAVTIRVFMEKPETHAKMAAIPLNDMEENK